MREVSAYVAILLELTQLAKQAPSVKRRQAVLALLTQLKDPALLDEAMVAYAKASKKSYARPAFLGMGKRQHDTVDHYVLKDLKQIDQLMAYYGFHRQGYRLETIMECIKERI